MTPSRLLAIDMLRGIAALAVVISHLPFSWSGEMGLSGFARPALPHWMTGLSHAGASGVNLFLVLSGFCIHMQWARRGAQPNTEVSFFDFWKRRLRRLYPTYFVALAVTLIGLLVVKLPSTRPMRGIADCVGYSSLSQLIADLVLLLVLAQNLNGASARVGNNPFWSLALEEQLYFLYFPFVWVRRKYGWRAALALVVGVTLTWRTAYANNVPGSPVYWFSVGPAYWLDWVLGAIAVEVHLGHVKISKWWSSPLMLVGLVLLAVGFNPPAWNEPGVELWNFPFRSAVSDAWLSLASFVMVNLLCAIERSGRLRHNWLATRLRHVGLFSYSLYLVHVPLQGLVKQLAVKAGMQSVFGILGLRFAVSLLGGALFYWLVERFFLARTRPPSVGAPPSVPTMKRPIGSSGGYRS